MQQAHQEGAELGVQQPDKAAQRAQLRLHAAAVAAEVGLHARRMHPKIAMLLP